MLHPFSTPDRSRILCVVGARGYCACLDCFEGMARDVAHRANHDAVMLRARSLGFVRETPGAQDWPLPAVVSVRERALAICESGGAA